MLPLLTSCAGRQPHGGLRLHRRALQPREERRALPAPPRSVLPLVLTRHADHGAGLGAGDKEAHAGDLGNIRADFFGVALVNKVYSIPLFEPGSGSLSSVVGRAIVVHELEDDLGQGDNSQPGVQGKTSKTTGNAGNRIACGVIVI